MKNHYPFPSFRPGVEEALDRADAAFASGKRFVIINAALGLGKSGISVACARKFRAPILTPTRLLQDQYANTKEFGQEYVIKGKSNYNCGLPGLSHLTVDQSICVSDMVAHNSRELVPFEFQSEKKRSAKALKVLCSDQELCPYYSKLFKIAQKPGAVMNYDLFFKIKEYPNVTWGTPMGDTIIFDEAHQLIDKVSKEFGFSFSEMSARRLLGDTSGKRLASESPLEWVKRIIQVAQVRLLDEKDSTKAQRYDSFIKQTKSITTQDITDEKKFFIDDRGNEIEIKPLDVRYLFPKIFHPFKRVLLLSATFPANFRQIFGISEEDSLMIDLPSTFQVKHRPVMFAKDLPRFNKDTVLSAGMPNMKLFDQILKTHKDHKGIVHTANYKMMEQLKQLYRNDRRFIWANRDMDKNQLLELHAESTEPTILISPSMMEGVDLRDDLARFGVILKVPYPALDDYTKRMGDIYPGWYDNLVATNICQAYGRQVRNEKDWARFYILDGAFNLCIDRSRRCYSEYFLSALKSGPMDRLIEILQKEENKG